MAKVPVGDSEMDRLLLNPPIPGQTGANPLNPRLGFLSALSPEENDEKADDDRLHRTRRLPTQTPLWNKR
jgi:hypothetical protein